MKTLYIRPTDYGFNICPIQKGSALVDQNIVMQFDRDYTGKEIRDTLADYYPDCIVKWGDYMHTS